MYYCSLFLSKGEPRRVNYWVAAMLAAVDDSWVLRTRSSRRVLGFHCGPGCNPGPAICPNCCFRSGTIGQGRKHKHLPSLALIIFF